jgi:peptide/nickel transport system ATP-binding protein
MNALEIKGLTVQFPTKSGTVTAVSDLDLAIPAGKTLGLVGESGSGKSTVAKAIMRLVRPQAGEISVVGEQLGPNAKGTAQLRRVAQLVFQDPNSSLNPRQTVKSVLTEASMRLPAQQRRAPGELLDLVALPSGLMDRFPHQLSGGQKQRVALARALAIRPSILLADEITSALDVSVQATVLNLLSELQQTLELTYLFISHNLAVVRHLSDFVSVMYLGRIVEHGTAEQVFTAPAHPYTRALLDAAPSRHAARRLNRERLEGEVPDPRFPPSGCVFHTRCPIGPLHHADRDVCRHTCPAQRPIGSSEHEAACHFPLDGAPANSVTVGGEAG